MAAVVAYTAGVDAFVWSHVLVGLLIFLVASIGGLAIVALVLIALPANYFSGSRPRDFWIEKHPLIRWTGLILKNFLGAVTVALGAILSLPGVPGPGILTMLIGIMLLDFPGKRRLELWLLSRPKVLGIINGLRRRYSKPPLDVEPGRKRSRRITVSKRTAPPTGPQAITNAESTRPR